MVICDGQTTHWLWFLMRMWNHMKLKFHCEFCVWLILNFFQCFSVLIKWFSTVLSVDQWSWLISLNYYKDEQNKNCNRDSLGILGTDHLRKNCLNEGNMCALPLLSATEPWWEQLKYKAMICFWQHASHQK